ncbi:MAG TPA: head-tail adaptor protein [Beijerinckiaceae bacterium]|jgi:head-tail adaptor
MTFVPAGARRRRFVLELPVASPDGFGGTLTSYVPGPVLWGSLLVLKGDERRRGDRPERATLFEVTLPYRPDLTGAMRLAAGPRRFVIRSADDPDGRRRSLVCRVEEIAP